MLAQECLLALDVGAACVDIPCLPGKCLAVCQVGHEGQFNPDVVG
jgi:hypothetical protein